MNNVKNVLYSSLSISALLLLFVILMTACTSQKKAEIPPVNNTVSNPTAHNVTSNPIITASPLPTFTPHPTKTNTPTPVHTITQTTVPFTQTPTKTPVLLPNVPTYIEDLSAWLTHQWQANADEKQVIYSLQEANWLIKYEGIPFLGVPGEPGWLLSPEGNWFTIDMDGDGTSEWIVSLNVCVDGSAPFLPPVRPQDCLTESRYPYPTGDLWIINDYGLVYRTYADIGEMNSIPLILAKSDLTGDSLPDILALEQSCGYRSSCFPIYRLITAHGGEFRAFRFSLLDSLIKLSDENNDGVLDVLVQGGTYKSWGAGPQRAVTDIWSWDGQDFTRIEHILSPINSRYHALLEANMLFEKENFEDAEAWYRRVIFDRTLTHWRYLEEELAMSQQYAAFCLTLLNLHRENLNEAYLWQDWVTENYPTEPLSKATNLLLDKWEIQQDVSIAYDLAVEFLDEENDAIPLRGIEGCSEYWDCLFYPISYMGYANDYPSLQVEDICKMR